MKEASQKRQPVQGRHQCRACPFRSFKERRRQRTHIQKYHTREKQYVPFGTKQLKVVLALYDHAASSQSSPVDFLQKSAAIIRASVKPPLASSLTLIDKHIRLVFDADGPRYVNKSTLHDEMQVRRVRNQYYTKAFADLLMREAVLCHAQATKLH